MTNHTLAANLISSKNPDQKSPCEVMMVKWDQRDRLKRAAITWTACWVGAFLAIFLPLIHFVLVPLLALSGPIGASFIYNQKEWITGGSGTCPLCKAPFQVAKGTVKWPLKDMCGKCGEEVHVQLKDVAQT